MVVNFVPTFFSDIGGQLTATGSASASGSSGASGGSAQKGGAIGMPTISGGLVGTFITIVAFLGGVARVMA